MARIAPASVLSAALILSLGGCAPAAPEPTSHSLTFTTVTDNTHSDWYKVNPEATATTDQFGTSITLGLSISSYNQTDIFPKAVITFEDGSKITCVETDPRHETALVESTTSIELPCPQSLPPSAKGAVVVVTEAN